jgi:hypothetical protein
VSAAGSVCAPVVGAHRISSKPASKAMKVCHELAAILIVAAKLERKELKYLM